MTKTYVYRWVAQPPVVHLRGKKYRVLSAERSWAAGELYNFPAKN